MATFKAAAQNGHSVKLHQDKIPPAFLHEGIFVPLLPYLNDIA